MTNSANKASTQNTKRGAATIADVAAALSCPAKAAASRLAALGYVEPCSRCAGSGHYSRCERYGTTCFKCGGGRKQIVRLTWAIVDAAKARQDAGELDAYFAKGRAFVAAKKAIKPALEALRAEVHGGAVRSRYMSLSEASDTHEFVNSAYFRASSLLCAIGDAAFQAGLAWEYRGAAPEATLAIIEEMMSYAQAVNAAAAPMLDAWAADIAERSVAPLAAAKAERAAWEAKERAAKAEREAERAAERAEHQRRMEESSRRWAEFCAQNA